MSSRHRFFFLFFFLDQSVCSTESQSVPGTEELRGGTCLLEFRFVKKIKNASELINIIDKVNKINVYKSIIETHRHGFKLLLDRTS